MKTTGKKNSLNKTDLPYSGPDEYDDEENEDSDDSYLEFDDDYDDQNDSIF